MLSSELPTVEKPPSNRVVTGPPPERSVTLTPQDDHNELAPNASSSWDSETTKGGPENVQKVASRVILPPLFTDLQLHDLGTGDPAKEKNSHGRGTNFDTSLLRAV